MGVESYMHKYAKTVLAGWLRKKIRIGENYKGLDNIPLCLLPEGGGEKYPMCNIYVEYPICKDKDGNVIGLTMNADKGDFDKSHIHPWEQWLKKYNRKFSAKHNVPSSFELKPYIDSGELTVLHIFDLIAIDPKKGCVDSVFEICHKHPVTPYKKKFIEDNGLKGYEISAEWIMNKVKSPFHVDCIQTF